MQKQVVPTISKFHEPKKFSTFYKEQNDNSNIKIHIKDNENHAPVYPLGNFYCEST